MVQQVLITLVPNSGVQFWDIPLDVEQLPRLALDFWEEPLGPRDSDGLQPVALRELESDDSGVLVDRHSGQSPPFDEIYKIGRNQAIEMHAERWVPMPYFLTMPGSVGGGDAYGAGPSNWARGRLAPNPGQGRSHTLTLAFDTALLPRHEDEPFTAPTPDSSALQQEFAFVADPAQNSWFLDESWIGEWLVEMLLEQLSTRRGRPMLVKDLPHACEHYARYQVFLQLMDASGIMPRVRLLDVVSANLGYLPVTCDLVLDIGNARTCGIIIEEHPGQGLNLSDSYELTLRDLSRPECTYNKPFDSRVEFTRASFGRDAISRRSGRASAFSWASPVRVGPEAVRLAGARLGNEGATGLSSPKRYLWDDRPTTQGWRFNGRAVDGVTTDPPVGGMFMTLVTEDGNVLRHRRGGQPAARARFSRSSIFTLMLAEIVLQVVGQINAPGARAQRRDANKPRQLRSVLMTMPPGMPVAEQRILRSRAEAAVKLAWDMLGLGSGVPLPRVVAKLDEATATQIVWLHNEVTERLGGDTRSLMSSVGRVRPGSADPTLRIASIDIGGGTTDLMISTYASHDGEAIEPAQEFRESFKVAGDDVLERVITVVVLPALSLALTEAGVRDARALLSRSLGQDQGGQSEQERHLRRLFVSMIMEPLGIAVLSAYEQLEGRRSGTLIHASIADLLGPAATARADRAIGYFQAAAQGAGAVAFTVAAVVLDVQSRQVEPVISAVLGSMLADLCEVVWHYDCDVLLLSGRPSRLRMVNDIVLAKTPVPPHRIIGMHRYRVGEKYPFRDAANRIDDPKTTVAVGAALCVQAEGRLRNFLLRTSRLSMRSTARYIGRMDINGQIRDENVLLSNLDLDGPAASDVGFSIAFQTVTQLGFRQLPLARWTATPLYVMEFSNPDTAARMALPLKVTVRRAEIDPETEQDHAGRETFAIDAVEDASGDRKYNSDVCLRLQTMDDGDGYWRDTGRLAIA
jgi:hypothetical protein